MRDRRISAITTKWLACVTLVLILLPWVATAKITPPLYGHRIQAVGREVFTPVEAFLGSRDNVNLAVRISGQAFIPTTPSNHADAVGLLEAKGLCGNAETGLGHLRFAQPRMEKNQETAATLEGVKSDDCVRQTGAIVTDGSRKRVDDEHTISRSRTIRDHPAGDTKKRLVLPLPDVVGITLCYGMPFPAKHFSMEAVPDRDSTTKTSPLELASRIGNLQTSNGDYREEKRVSSSETSGRQQDWYAIAFQPDLREVEGANERSAKLCFVYDPEKSEQECFEATARITKTLYKFPFVDELSVLPIHKDAYPREGILFVARFSGGGSGTLSLITIWVFDQGQGKFRNILPVITITEQGQYMMLRDEKAGIAGTLVIADYIWGEGETHFQPHKYHINIYRYDAESRLFRSIGSYITEAKFESLDDVNNIDVITRELDHIKAFIQWGTYK